MKSFYLAFLLLFTASLTVAQQTYYVSTTGLNDAGRDGLSTATAWKSLAYACDRVPESTATIQLGAGTFSETETAYLKSGFTIRGAGKGLTIVTNAPTFVAQTGRKDYQAYRAQNYLIYVPAKRVDIIIEDMSFRSPEANRLHGAINLWDSDRIRFERLSFNTFSWNALRMNRSDDIDILHCDFHNASLERHESNSDPASTSTESSGAVRALYHKRVEMAFCTITSDKSDGYGYKGGGHEDFKFHDNVIAITGYFGIEIPHENEAGVEIYDNSINRCISVPKHNGGSNPASKGFNYAIWIHDNELSDSYTVEGPRNYLRITDNHVEITKGNGRFYTQHGGTGSGPVLIAHNTISVAPTATLAKPFRGFMFVRGTARNVEVYNNTVYFHNGGWAIDKGDATISGWQVRNNVFVDPTGGADATVNMVTGASSVTTSEIIFSNNLVEDLGNVPTQGATLQTDPGLTESGARPAPYFVPSAATSVVVNAGVDVGRPFEGSAPDIGAHEWIGAPPPVTHTITASAGANGSISPSGAVTVNEGSDRSFTITANAGYEVADVLVNGSSIGVQNSHTFTNVTANHTISASFVSSAVPVTSITISGPSTITTDGGTAQLTADVLPANVTDPSVTWSIQGTTLGATVSASGLVTASGETTGNGTITVRAMANDGSGVSDDYDVAISNQVSPPPPPTGDQYYVALDGADDAGRDGHSPATAWRTLVYATGRIPAGVATINMGAGEFAETGTSLLRADWTLRGAGASATKITNAASFVATGDNWCDYDGAAQQLPNPLVVQRCGPRPRGVLGCQQPALRRYPRLVRYQPGATRLGDPQLHLVGHLPAQRRRFTRASRGVHRRQL